MSKLWCEWGISLILRQERFLHQFEHFAVNATKHRGNAASLLI